MSESIEELSIEKWEDGELVIEQLDKNVLTKGAWVTILYHCREINPKTGDFKPANARLVRYRKLRGKYVPQSKFNISSGKQALEIAKTLESWFS